jgi:glutathione S-transferase
MLRLISANLNYSSWTARVWLALRRAGVAFELHDIGLYTRPGWEDRVHAFSGAGKVPVLVDGPLTIHESLAICEYLNEKYPEARLWPEDSALRARGRAICCEMLSGFLELRNQLPMNVRGRARVTPTGPTLAAEVERVLDIWESFVASSSGDFLLGDFSIADCMFFPVVSRFRTYGIELSEGAERYAAAIFSEPTVRELERRAAAEPAIPRYDAALG